MSVRSIRIRLLRTVVAVAVAGAVLSGPISAAPEVPTDEVSVRHAISRLTFGVRPGDVARVTALGLTRWMDEQLTPRGDENPALRSRLDAFDTLALDSASIARDYVLPARDARRARQQAAAAAPQDPASGNGPAQVRRPNATAMGQRLVLEELASAKLLRAVYSDRQLEEVLVDFWFNHFNVFAGKGRVPMLVTAYERDAIRPYVWGSFRELLGATAHSPAMLFYLDNWLSSAPTVPVRPRARRAGAAGANVRRTAGINENYGRELLELHTLGVDGGYTQQDIVEVARAFTGWTIDPRTQAFRFASDLHDTGAKTVLGQRLAAGGGERDGERVLDLLATHPSTARHIAFKLARRFVSDTPPAGLVDRAAETFRRTNGNLRDVVRTIVTSPEFFEPAVARVKVKTPFEFVASAVRALDADVRTPRPLLRSLQELGMPSYLCQPPTGYADTADAWVSSGALVSRMNLALDLASPERPTISAPSLRADIIATRRQLLTDVLGGTVAPDTRSIIESATTMHQMVALVLGSPEFQRR